MELDGMIVQPRLRIKWYKNMCIHDLCQLYFCLMHVLWTLLHIFCIARIFFGYGCSFLQMLKEIHHHIISPRSSEGSLITSNPTQMTALGCYYQHAVWISLKHQKIDFIDYRVNGEGTACKIIMNSDRIQHGKQHRNGINWISWQHNYQRLSDQTYFRFSNESALGYSGIAQWHNITYLDIFTRSSLNWSNRIICSLQTIINESSL